MVGVSDKIVVVAYNVGLALRKITKTVFVLPRERNKVVSKLAVHHHRGPAVVYSLAIKHGHCLLRVELGTKKWILLALHSCSLHFMLTLRLINNRSQFKHITKTLVSLKLLHRDSVVMRLQQHGVGFKQICALTHLAKHTG